MHTWIREWESRKCTIQLFDGWDHGWEWWPATSKAKEQRNSKKLKTRGAVQRLIKLLWGLCLLMGKGVSRQSPGMYFWGVDSEQATGILPGIFQFSEGTGVGSVLRTHSQVLWLVHEVVVSWATCVSWQQCYKGPGADPNPITLHHTVGEIFYRSIAQSIAGYFKGRLWWLQ